MKLTHREKTMKQKIEAVISELSRIQHGYRLERCKVYVEGEFKSFTNYGMYREELRTRIETLELAIEHVKTLLEETT